MLNILNAKTLRRSVLVSQMERDEIDRVVTARMELDATKRGTPEREAADREYESALTAFRMVADKHRRKSN